MLSRDMSSSHSSRCRASEWRGRLSRVFTFFSDLSFPQRLHPSLLLPRDFRMRRTRRPKIIICDELAIQRVAHFAFCDQFAVERLGNSNRVGIGRSSGQSKSGRLSLRMCSNNSGMHIFLCLHSYPHPHNVEHLCTAEHRLATPTNMTCFVATPWYWLLGVAPLGNY